MKIYRGIPPHEVRVEPGEGGGIYPLPHIIKHSPTGFAWGYGGSGPTELARCILIDLFTPLNARCPRCRGRGTNRTVTKACDACTGEGYLVPPGVYQSFKWNFLAKLPSSEPWEISEEQIREWLHQYPGKHLIEVKVPS